MNTPLGYTWQLPEDATCARQARSCVADALGALAVPQAQIEDAKVMVSELAGNLIQHAAGHRPHELWLHRAGRAGLVVSVFDTSPVFPAQTRPNSDDLRCDGRGLAIVGALSDGIWGVRVSRSRQPFSMPGKNLWFGISLQAERALTRPEPRTSETGHLLRACLQARGIAPVYLSERDGICVVSLPYELTVWLRDGDFRWLRPDACGYEARPLADFAATVEDLVHRYEVRRRAAMTLR
jgi:anti-sigma regulatory factor (Ser/Thr protein kinase)